MRKTSLLRRKILENLGGAAGEVGELQMAGLNVGEGPLGAQEVETDSSYEDEDDAVFLVLVQKDKYKWPAIIHAREDTQVQVQHFNK